ncbi:alpha-L-fucosidase [Polaribacter sp. Q13]|uniref:alpha-L-fucosidase n=1 Tax=Polaribacter sp. Q13 TaxID=2806551 RepID=UPI00193BD379|nr:alpha-L-fucosidase [Polaribacter sp. Q13]QVY66000.1 alpha-L-fucosidase [Polaribacter sp. Q13]
MNTKKYIIFLLIGVLSISCKVKNEQIAEASKEQYQANWTSLRKHQTPNWFDDLKFGIYCHWGPQTVEVMYKKDEITRLQAIEKWKGDKFSAKNWVDVMQRTGAQFGGPVAWHGSGIVNWDSDITNWNSTKKGPKVDIYGSLSKELHKRGMPVIASYHIGDFWSRMWGQISLENKSIIDPTQDNSKYAVSNNGRISDEIFDAWYARISESVDKYQPDMIWFDTGFGGTVHKVLKKEMVNGRLLPNVSNKLISAPETYQQKMISYFFNKGLEWNKEVEVIYKTHDIPVGIGVRDIEDGNLLGLQYDPWMADVNMQRHFDWRATWFYNPLNKVKDAGMLVRYVSGYD